MCLKASINTSYNLFGSGLSGLGYIRGDYSSEGLSLFAGGALVALEHFLDFVWPVGIIPFILFGTYSPTNLELLADKLEALLADNPDSEGFWMCLEQDYNGWMVWLSFTDATENPVDGWWGSHYWGIDTLLAQGAFLDALWSLHNQYPSYDFTTDQQP